MRGEKRSGERRERILPPTHIHTSIDDLAAGHAAEEEELQERKSSWEAKLGVPTLIRAEKPQHNLTSAVCMVWEGREICITWENRQRNGLGKGVLWNLQQPQPLQLPCTVHIIWFNTITIQVFQQLLFPWPNCKQFRRQEPVPGGHYIPVGCRLWDFTGWLCPFIIKFFLSIF